jgi:hypothetical protein
MPNLANGWETIITGSISDSDTSVGVSSTAGIPDRPFQATYLSEAENKDEVITVTDLTGSIITFVRATEAIADGTQVAQAHAAGATISHRLTKKMLTDIAYWSRGPVDTPPAVANPMDDEFEGDSLDNKWTVWNQTTGQLVRLASSHLNLYSPYTLQRRVFAVIQPAPSGTWCFRFKSMLDAATWNYMSTGPIVRRVTGHDYSVEAFLGYYGGQQGSFYSMRLDGVTYRDSETDLYNFQFPCYQEVEYDGTNIIFRCSGVGDFYSEVTRFNAASDIGGAPEWVGMNIQAWGDGNSLWHGSASFDWFRRQA